MAYRVKCVWRVKGSGQKKGASVRARSKKAMARMSQFGKLYQKNIYVRKDIRGYQREDEVLREFIRSGE